MSFGNVDAERNLLGCAMFDNSIYADIAANIKAEDFYRIEHRLVFDAMGKLAKEGKAFDTVTLWDAIKQNGHEGRVDLQTVMGLQVPTAVNYKSYLSIVKREAVRKELWTAARNIAQISKESNDVEEMVASSQKILNDIDKGAAGSDAELAGDMTEGIIEELYRNSEKEFTGLQTGFRALDKMLDGMHESELIILAARPGMGKTAFALNVALNVAKEKTVLMFSLEMSKNSLVRRLMSIYTGISREALKHPHRLPDGLQQRLYMFADHIRKCKLIISDKAEQTIAMIRATARIVKHQQKALDLIIIDYLSLIKGSGNENREQEVAEISRQLKVLAKEYNVPVMALAQVNRGAENRQIKKPALSELRESGAIEQDADVVLFLYRDEYYNPMSEKRNQCDVIIAKHRDGGVGDVALYFNAALTKFGNLEAE